MHIREEYTQPVRPRDFWIAVGVTAVLLGGIGVFTVNGGDLPEVPRWVGASTLMMVWSALGVGLLRFGRRAVSAQYLLVLAGCTLLFGGDVFPQMGHAAPWAKGVGSLLMGMNALVTFIGFGKKPRRPDAGAAG
jgi:hypothetical protein